MTDPRMSQSAAEALSPAAAARAVNAAPGDNFASDNNAALCPEAQAALLEADSAGHAWGYGSDPWSERAAAALRARFEAPEAAVFFVFTGTAANALALASLCRGYHAILCHDLAHIARDENTAIAFYSGGAALWTIDTPQAKLTPEAIRQAFARRADIHAPKPRALSLTNTTELGTVYRSADLKALTAEARALGLRTHLDGARFANALAATGESPADLSWRAGIDILVVGATKAGAALGEAVMIFDPELAAEFTYRVKQAGQLASKMRYLTAPWLGLLEGDAWIRHAAHANAMAARLASGLQSLPGARLIAPVEANAVFVDLEPALQAGLRARGWRFYTLLGETGCRLMCAWDTRPESVDRLLEDAQALSAG